MGKRFVYRTYTTHEWVYKCPRLDRLMIYESWEGAVQGAIICGQQCGVFPGMPVLDDYENWAGPPDLWRPWMTPAFGGLARWVIA